MPYTLTQRIGRTLGLGCVVSTLLVSGCQDVGEDPMAIYVSAGADGAALLGESLPTIPTLLLDYGLETEGVAEMEAWEASWADGEGGVDLREVVHRSSVERLLPLMGRSGVEDVIARNALNIDAVEDLGPMIQSPAIRQALGGAGAFLDEARAALVEGREGEALLLALKASDTLWEVSPQQVAANLLRLAEDHLRRNGPPPSYTEEELTRVRRLMFGSSEARKNGDYPGAIRRAYYACQLLGVEFP